LAGYSILMESSPEISLELALDLPEKAEAARLFAESAGIMARLRGPGGCPWDREQSFDTIRKHTLEETYEVLDAIERRDWPHLAEELGDLLLQVLFYAEMGSELGEGRFSIEDVLGELNRKLIRRHPHVFGAEASAGAGNRAVVDAAVDGSSERVLANWEAIKKAEKKTRVEASLLDGVQRGQPALAEAAKIGSKAAKVGFDWPDWRNLLDKLDEETAELVVEAEAVAAEPERQAAVEAELGDLLFTVVNLGRHLSVDAEMALRGTNLRFRKRFRAMEEATSRPLGELKPEELEALWVGAKKKLSEESR